MEVTAQLEKERWFVATEAGTVEYPVDELQNAIAVGLVTQHSLVWREGMNEWLELAQVPPLALLLPAAASFTRARSQVAHAALLKDEQAEDKTTVLNELPSPEPSSSSDNRRLVEEEDEKTLLIDVRARRAFIQPLAPLQVPAIRAAVLSRQPSRSGATPVSASSPAPAPHSSHPPGTQTARMPVATAGALPSGRPAIERAPAPRFTLNARPIVSVGTDGVQRQSEAFRPMGLPDRPSHLPPSDRPSAAPSLGVPAAQPQHAPTSDSTRDSALTPTLQAQQSQRAPTPTPDSTRDSALTPALQAQQPQRAPTPDTTRDSALTPTLQAQQPLSFNHASPEQPRHDSPFSFIRDSAPPPPQRAPSPSYVLSNTEPPARVASSTPAATTDVPLLIKPPQARTSAVVSAAAGRSESSESKAPSVGVAAAVAQVRASPIEKAVSQPTVEPIAPRNSKPTRARYAESDLGLVASPALTESTEHIASSSLSLPLPAPRTRQKWVLGIAGSAVALAAVIGTLMSLRGAVAEVDSAHPSPTDGPSVSAPRVTPVAVALPAAPAEPKAPSAVSAQKAGNDLPQSSPPPSPDAVTVANRPRSPANSVTTREAPQHREPAGSSAITSNTHVTRAPKSDGSRPKGTPPAAAKAASGAASESSVAAWERGNAESRTWMQPGF